MDESTFSGLWAFVQSDRIQAIGVVMKNQVCAQKAFPQYRPAIQTIIEPEPIVEVVVEVVSQPIEDETATLPQVNITKPENVVYAIANTDNRILILAVSVGAAFTSVLLIIIVTVILIIREIKLRKKIIKIHHIEQPSQQEPQFESEKSESQPSVRVLIIESQPENKGEEPLEIEQPIVDLEVSMDQKEAKISAEDKPDKVIVPMLTLAEIHLQVEAAETTRPQTSSFRRHVNRKKPLTQQEQIRRNLKIEGGKMHLGMLL